MILTCGKNKARCNQRGILYINKLKEGWREKVEHGLGTLRFLGTTGHTFGSLGALMNGLMKSKGNLKSIRLYV